MNRSTIDVLVFIVVMLAAAVSCNQLEAAEHEGWYVFGAAGQSDLRHSGENKWWIQEGFPYSIDGRSTVWLAGAGYRWGRYLAAEISGGPLGRYRHTATFLADESLYDQTSPTLCRTPWGGTPQCPTSTGHLRGSVRALHLSVLPTWPVTDDLILYLKAGATHYRATFAFRIEPDLPGELSFSESRWTMHYGIGAAWRGCFVEAMKYPAVEVRAGGSPVSAYRHALTVMVGYRLSL